MREACICATAWNKSDAIPDSADACWRPRGQNNTGTSNTVNHRGNGGLAPPAVHQTETVGLPAPERSGSPLIGLRTWNSHRSGSLPSSGGGGCQADSPTVQPALSLSVSIRSSTQCRTIWRLQNPVSSLTDPVSCQWVNSWSGSCYLDLFECGSFSNTED